MLPITNGDQEEELYLGLSDDDGSAFKDAAIKSARVVYS
jgi:hypothetical protein